MRKMQHRCRSAGIHVVRRRQRQIGQRRPPGPIVVAKDLGRQMPRDRARFRRRQACAKHMGRKPGLVLDFAGILERFRFALKQPFPEKPETI